MDNDLKEKFFQATAAYNEFATSFKAEMLKALKKYGLDGKLLPGIEINELVKHKKYVGAIKIYGTTNHLSRQCPYYFIFVSNDKDDDGKPIYKHSFNWTTEWAVYGETIDDFVQQELVPWCRKLTTEK